MLVVGMHRSGTSAVTRAVAALGRHPGVDALMAATDDNPTGHFEVTRMTALDDELLDALGGRWSAPPAAGPAEVAALTDTDLAAKARDLISEVFTDAPWVWKDPRVALLVPFWRTVLSPEPAVVLVLRHPLEVARSLAARNGMGLEYGLALWERYTRTVLRDLQGMTVLVIDYGDAMADPARAVRDIADFLAEAEPAGGHSVGDGLDAFVTDHHRQQVASSEFRAESAVTDEVRALHDLTRGLRGAHAAFPGVELGSETTGLQRAFDEHKRMSRYEERSYELEAEVTWLESQVRDLRTEIDRRSEQAGHLAAETMALRDERSSLSARLIELETWWPVLTAMRIRRVFRRLTRRS